MSVALNFSTQGIGLDDQISLFPEGWYKVAIESSESQKLNDNASHALKLNCKIIEPQSHAGQTYGWLLNLYHASSEAAVAAAKRDLARVCMVIGKPGGVQASGELHGIPFAIHLKVTDRKVRQNDGSEKSSQINNVDSIRDLNGRTPKEISGGAPPGNPGPGTAPQGYAAPPAAQPQPQPPMAQPAGPPAGYAAPAAQPPAQQWQQPAAAPPAGGFQVDRAPQPTAAPAAPGPTWPGAGNAQPVAQPATPPQHAPWAGPGQ